MGKAASVPFAHGCVLGIGLAKMPCIIPYGRRPPHGFVSYYDSLPFWLVKRQNVLYRSTRTGRAGHLAGRIAGGGHARVTRRGRSHPLLARAQGTSAVSRYTGKMNCLAPGCNGFRAAFQWEMKCRADEPKSGKVRRGL